MVVLRALDGCGGWRIVVVGPGCIVLPLTGSWCDHRRLEIMRITARRCRLWQLLLSPWRENPVVVIRRRIIGRRRWPLSLVWNGEIVAFLRVTCGGIGSLRLSNWSCWRRRPIVVRLRGTILCRRPELRRRIVPVSAGGRIVHKVRTVHDKCETIATELIAARTASGRRGCIPD